MEKRFILTPLRGALKRPLLWSCLLMAALLFAALSGCGDDNEGNVTQIPYPEPDVTTWLFSIWGTAEDDIWVVGRPGVVLHWNGTAWSLQEIGEHIFTDVWGTAANDVYAVGHEGVIYHYNGSSWSSMDSGTEENLYAVGMGPYDAIYACGERGNIRRLNGGSWGGMQNFAFRYNDDGVPSDTLLFAEDIQSLTTVTPYALAGDAATVLMENDSEVADNQWWWGPIEDNTGAMIRAGISSSVPGENYVGNEDGRMLQLEEDSFGELSWRRVVDFEGNFSDPITVDHAITGMWANPANGQIYLTTWAGEIATWAIDGTGTELLYASNGWLSDVWGTDDGQVWAVGKDGELLYSADGTTFAQVENVPLPEVSKAKSAAVTDKFGRIVP